MEPTSIEISGSGRHRDGKVLSLVVVGGPLVGTQFEIQRTVTIGRDPISDIVLHDPTVAWHHASIEPWPLGWGVVHVAAKGRTYVNGEAVEQRLLETDDEIVIGSTRLLFKEQTSVERDFQSAVEDRIHRDDLTGLMSRRRLEHVMQLAIEQAAAAQRPVACVLFDVDKLKQVNDTYGHLAGAQVIHEVGRIIRAACSEQAKAGRLGGDEYAVVITDPEATALSSFVRQISDNVRANTITHEGHDLSVTISIGVFVGVPPRSGDWRDVLHQADLALLEAKRAGGDRIVGVVAPRRMRSEGGRTTLTVDEGR